MNFSVNPRKGAATRKGPFLRTVSFKLSEEMIATIEDVIQKGTFISRSEFMRIAVFQLVQKLETEVKKDNETD